MAQGNSEPRERTVQQGRPLQLVQQDETTGEWKLGEEAMAALTRIKAPIAVISVCGRARTGKSYILNQLLGTSAGFEVAASYRPCTKGLWMWSQPIRRTALDGSNYYLVLLDTEGIDAYNQTTQDGVSLFSLAVLLSSLFVFNQMGGIDEAALDRLALVTELTRRIRVRSSGGPGGSGAGRGSSGGSGGGWGAGGGGDAATNGAAGNGKAKGKGDKGPKGDKGAGARADEAPVLEDVSALAEFTPSFMWLLRDFYYDLEADGVRQSPRDYLETALMPTAGKGPAVEAKNMIRESIKALFPDRDCATLVRPVSDEAALRALGSLPQEQLRPEFVQGVERLTATLHARAQPKRLGTQLLTGPLLAGLAVAYVKAINTGAVPTIASAWHSVAEAECRAACYAAEDAYRDAFNPNTPPDEQALSEEHARALAAADRAFKERAVGDPGLQARFAQRYVAACGLAFEAVRERRLAAAAEALERQLQELASQLHAEARGADMDFARIAASVEAGISGVVRSTVGTARWPRLLNFCHAQYAALGCDLAERQAAAAAFEAQRRELEGRAQAAEFDRLRRDNEDLQAKLAAATRRADEAVAAREALALSGAAGKGGRKGGGWDDEPRRAVGCFGF
ncbi:hypothetical protein HYH03_000050 [Edaphochlamys debaryana]|uniref:GB1/RHD3-type G domain-containing protein n=1 Tax=Edaphochlamys debaryana TaxID=47281 RepID=A0A835YF46_9CHLO|nr:hypothetical protein HYH03_000050 [Edaphochlamys debaryana]|eukprot:KAG2501543.1 hypothetical protein HYH03_000050 [Edaphochlamys debaryana]